MAPRAEKVRKMSKKKALGERACKQHQWRSETIIYAAAFLGGAGAGSASGAWNRARFLPYLTTTSISCRWTPKSLSTESGMVCNSRTAIRRRRHALNLPIRRAGKLSRKSAWTTVPGFSVRPVLRTVTLPEKTGSPAMQGGSAHRHAQGPPE